MIEVYSWATPNGHKIHIMLEECGLAYRAIPVDIGKGDQFKPEFLAISPNNKIPAIVDPDGPDAAHLEHQPLERLVAAAKVFGKEAPRLRRQVDQDRARFKQRDRPAVGPMLGQTHH